MATTDNLGLYITDDSSVDFQTYRRKVAGTGADSNMKILDAAVAGLCPVAFSVTLTSGNWHVMLPSPTYTASDARFLTGDYAYIIQPAPSSVEAWGEFGIVAGDIDTAGRCVFRARYSQPDTDITAYVLRIKTAV